jgi:deoxynucleotide monophosphate kinase-like protein
MYKIGISGKAGSGKNTLAQIIYKELYDHAIWRDKDEEYMIAFADPIKQLILDKYPQADRECLYGSSYLREKIIPNAMENGKPITYRKALCDIGTEHREQNNDYWVEKLNEKYIDLLTNNYIKIAIVPDIRFRNEFDYLKQNKFFLIRLYREVSSNTGNHISETNQLEIMDDEFNYRMYNNTTLEDLKKEVQNKIIPQITKST